MTACRGNARGKRARANARRWPMCAWYRARSRPAHCRFCSVDRGPPNKKAKIRPSFEGSCEWQLPGLPMRHPLLCRESVGPTSLRGHSPSVRKATLEQPGPPFLLAIAMHVMARHTHTGIPKLGRLTSGPTSMPPPSPSSGRRHKTLR
eukprot:362089-Chlamydomonas_euryale.AAC.4